MSAPVLLVTGGSRGIGAATALAGAKAGYAVAVNYQSNSLAADEVVRRIREAGGQAMALQADVSREDEVLALFARIDAKWGPLAALVNNAGVVDVSARVDAMTVARLSRMLNTHVLGSFVCAREAVLRMSTRHGGAGGAIVNLGSVAARIGSPAMYVDYAASKGAIDTFTIGLAQELAAEGIRVNAVRPGIIDTDIHADSGDRNRPQAAAALIPMGRPGAADEIAAAVLWLLSAEASYATGAILDVGGAR